MRVAYADPPYPGQALRHYGKTGDPFEGEIAEIDHAELIERLEAEFPDGWALSTSVPALGDLLALCPQPDASKKRTWNGRAGVKLGTGVRVGAWLRSAGSPFPPSRVMWAGARHLPRATGGNVIPDFIRDSLVASQPHGFLGNVDEDRAEYFRKGVREAASSQPMTVTRTLRPQRPHRTRSTAISTRNARAPSGFERV
jgi:hypothetical protein